MTSISTDRQRMLENAARSPRHRRRAISLCEARSDMLRSHLVRWPLLANTWADDAQALRK